MREKELRLALVCYGGISLAVYMHGITKEVWHLLRASHALAAGEEPGDAVERLYRDLLAELEEQGGTRVRVIADIVAGASAGGINGIFLAQAIATGQSLAPLTELWLASADVEALLDPSAAPSSRFSKLWAEPLAWMAAGRSAESVDALSDEATRAEVRAKLSRFVRSRWFEPPFGGETFTGLLLDALAAMAASEPGPRLLPPGQPLDLFVTVTDFTGHPERLTLHSPAEVMETEHRLVIGFRDGGDGHGLGDAADLAFAARATSSFPGAFPPFRVGELDAVLKARHRRWPGRRRFLAHALPHQSAAGQAERTVLIDGSVLANAPFRPAIEALRDRPARRQVDRRFVYVDPKPGLRHRAGAGGEAPGFFATILGAISDLPRQQPIRDNLEAIADRSRRIERMLGVVAAIRPEVESAIEGLFGRTFFLDHPTPARLVGWRRRAQSAAAAHAGYSHAAYARLKVEGVLDQLAGTVRHAGIRPGDDPAGAARALFAATPQAEATASEAGLIDFLRRFDLGFRIRRLRLLARRLAEVEERIAEVAAAPVRAAIYDSLAAYLDRQRLTAHDAAGARARQLPDDAGAMLDARSDSLDLTALDAATDERLAAALAGVDRETRRALLLAYLGFAYYDVATLPLLQGEGLDEFDPIKVDRVSPDDAPSIRAGGAEATLKGIQFNSFGAFFSRAYRENDYLWGRLHGAERMVDITVSTLPAGTRLRPGRVAAIKRALFRAILDEEASRLGAVATLVESLRAEIG
jgi:patatin-related protein